jgi:hypothetical protein
MIGERTVARERLLAIRHRHLRHRAAARTGCGLVGERLFGASVRALLWTEAAATIPCVRGQPNRVHDRGLALAAELVAASPRRLPIQVGAHFELHDACPKTLEGPTW